MGKYNNKEEYNIKMEIIQRIIGKYNKRENNNEDKIITGK